MKTVKDVLSFVGTILLNFFLVGIFVLVVCFFAYHSSNFWNILREQFFWVTVVAGGLVINLWLFYFLNTEDPEVIN